LPHHRLLLAEYPTSKAPLTGARVSYFNINAKTRKLMDAGLAFKSIRNRAGKLVKKPEDLDFSA